MRAAWLSVAPPCTFRAPRLGSGFAVSGQDSAQKWILVISKGTKCKAVGGRQVLWDKGTLQPISQQEVEQAGLHTPPPSHLSSKREAAAVGKEPSPSLLKSPQTLGVLSQQGPGYHTLGAPYSSKLLLKHKAHCPDSEVTPGFSGSLHSGKEEAPTSLTHTL